MSANNGERIFELNQTVLCYYKNKVAKEKRIFFRILLLPNCKRLKKLLEIEDKIQIGPKPFL